MESIDPLPEKASLSAAHDLTEKGMKALDPLPEKANGKASTRTAPSVSDKEGVNSPHPLPEKASIPTAPVASEGKGVVSLDPLQDKASEGLEGKETVMSPLEAGICDLLAGYFKYYATEFLACPRRSQYSASPARGTTESMRSSLAVVNDSLAGRFEYSTGNHFFVGLFAVLF